MSEQAVAKRKVGVHTRVVDVILAYNTMKREENLPKLRTACKSDRSVGILEALQYYRGEKVNPECPGSTRITENMWAAVFGFTLGRLKRLYPARIWDMYHDEVEEYVMLFFEHSKQYADIDTAYYIYCWKMRLPVVHLWVQLKNMGMDFPIPPRTCTLMKRKKLTKNTTGCGGILRPFKEIERQQLMFLMELDAKYGGGADPDTYMREYMKQTKYNSLNKSKRGIANFKRQLVKWWLAKERVDDLRCTVKDQYQIWIDQQL